MKALKASGRMVRLKWYVGFEIVVVACNIYRHTRTVADDDVDDDDVGDAAVPATAAAAGAPAAAGDGDDGGYDGKVDDWRRRRKKIPRAELIGVLISLWTH